MRVTPFHLEFINNGEHFYYDVEYIFFSASIIFSLPLPTLTIMSNNAYNKIMQ